MTGYSIYKRALSELKLTESAENITESISDSILNVVNDIGNDLIKDFHLNSIFEETDIAADILPAFTYGVAMMISGLYGMEQKNSFFTNLYNMKRASVKSEHTSVKNVIPAR